jgi:hypothetical protein
MSQAHGKRGDEGHESGSLEGGSIKKVSEVFHTQDQLRAMSINAFSNVWGGLERQMSEVRHVTTPYGLVDGYEDTIPRDTTAKTVSRGRAQ